MKIQRIKLAELTPDPKNTRIHDDANIKMIKQSLEKFGQYRAMVVQIEGMIVRVGNGMFKAMTELGWDTAECQLMDLTDEDATVLSILDNKSSDLSFFDDNKLVSTLNNLSNTYLDLAGFSKEQINHKDFSLNKSKGHFSKEEPASIAISFNDEAQLQKWEAFLSYLSMRYPDKDRKLSDSEKLYSFFLDEKIIKEERYN